MSKVKKTKLRLYEVSLKVMIVSESPQKVMNKLKKNLRKAGALELTGWLQNKDVMNLQERISNKGKKEMEYKPLMNAVREVLRQEHDHPSPNGEVKSQDKVVHLDHN